MKIPQTRFRIPSFYGDNDWHIANLPDYPLTIRDPNTVVIGVTTSLHVPLTKLKSNYLWRYGFASSSSGRWYGTSTGSNGSTSIVDLNVGVTSTSNYYSAGVIEEAFRTEGSSTLSKVSIDTMRFSSYTSWYFTPVQSSTPTAANRAIVCKFVASYEADLPTDLYTISGTNITWNTSNPVYILLYGKDCIAY